jgi:alpha-L-fucosidase
VLSLRGIVPNAIAGFAAIFILMAGAALRAQNAPEVLAPEEAGLPAYAAVVRDEAPEATAARLKWFTDARVGVMFQWGDYSFPVMKDLVTGVKPEGYLYYAEQAMFMSHASVGDYTPRAKQFTAEKYEPADWAQLAKDAGAKYVGITAKSYDGFALFDSKASNWNAAKASGAGRDLIKPLAAAVKARGMKFGCYYSQSVDWVNPGGAIGAQQEWDAAHQGSFDDYLAAVSLPQVREIIQKFSPDIIWWDSPYQMTPKRAMAFFDVVTSNPDLIESDHLGGGVIGDFFAPTKPTAPNEVFTRPVEIKVAPARVYVRNNNRNDPIAGFIRAISQTAGRGENALVMVDPDAQGVIPQYEIDELLALGQWLKINGEAIYGTQRSPFAAEVPLYYCTRRTRDDGGATLYVHFYDWPPGGRITLHGILQPPTGATLLANGAGVPTRFSRVGLDLALPRTAPDPYVSVVQIDFAAPMQRGR